MASKDAYLYGKPQKSKTKAKEIASTSTSAFSTALSGLIKSASKPAASDASKPTGGRARPTKKEDIFSTHNKNVKKRALKDLEDSEFTQQKHRGRTAEEKQDDNETWRRTKRRMEEKARLYDALKRGDVEDHDDKYGVDFDRKWADAQERGEQPPEDSDSDEESAASDEELVEYLDEFGRTRTGTRAEKARQERMMRSRDIAAEPDRFTARPVMPENLIFGDTVQTDAFNPDETIAQQMADLASKRDEEDNRPPPDFHFDSTREKRQHGTAFFQFSHDEEVRKEQFANLEKERQETAKAREARKKRIDERAKIVEEKKRKLMEQKVQAKADRFLNELGAELFQDNESAEKSEERS